MAYKTEPWKNLEKELAKRTRRDQILLYAYKPWAELKGDIVSEFFKYMRRGLVRVIEDFDEKHFFVEERAIFTSYNPNHIEDGHQLFFDLSKEHTVILEKVESLRKRL